MREVAQVTVQVTELRLEIREAAEHRLAALTFHQPFGTAARVIVGIAGAATLLAPYELLIRPGVPVFTPAMIPLWIIALGALSIGVVCAAAALLGLPKTVTFDTAQRAMRTQADGSFGLRLHKSYPFADLGAVTVTADDNTDGPTRYRLAVAITGRRHPYEIETFAREADAQTAAERVRAVIGGFEA